MTILTRISRRGCGNGEECNSNGGGNGGHTFSHLVAGKPRTERIDRRITRKNGIYRRTNLRLNGNRPYISSSEYMDGTYYQDNLLCMTCNNLKNRREFSNYAVKKSIRNKNGCNIHCRSCQPRQYDNGYLIDGTIEKSIDEKSIDEQSIEDTDEEDNDDELVDTDDETETDTLYEVEAIYGHTYDKHNKLTFEVKWVGYPKTTMEPETYLREVDVFRIYVTDYLIRIRYKKV